MSISITQQRPDFDMAYGPQPVTLSGLTTEDKYGLQIQGPGGTPLYADIRQTANQSGDAIFDIQNILQSFISAPGADLPLQGVGSNRPILAIANGEVFQYVITFGSDTNGVFTGTATTTNKNVIGGTKPYYDEAFSFTTGSYRTQATAKTDGSPNGCTITQSQANPLSSWRESVTCNTITDGKPSDQYFTQFSSICYVKNVDVGSFESLTYFNNVLLGNPTPTLAANHIGGYRVVVYNNNTQVHDFVIPNITANGGGPNALWNGSVAGNGDSTIVSIGSGPGNIQSFSYEDTAGSTVNKVISPNTYTHYYIYPVAISPTNCLSTHTGYGDEPLGVPVRYNRIIQTNCLDYEHFQFAWLNPYGVLDYYTFNKLNRKSLRTTPNNFLKEPADYSSDGWSVLPENRGYQTYSQKTEERFIANTGYMTDTEAEYLQYLFSSPDVRVRLGNAAPLGYEGTFFPINVLSNTWQQKSFLRDQLFQYEISFKIAHNVKAQRG